MNKEPALEKGHKGCSHCPGNEVLLDMSTKLYNGFGGYRVSKDGETVYFADPNLKWEEYDTLVIWEEKAKLEPDADWRVHLDLPLRDAEWQRHEDNRWVLIKSGLGFA